MTRTTTLTRSHALLSQSISVLDRISEQDVHLAIWQRERPSRIDWLDTLDFAAIEDFSFPCALEDLAQEIPEALDEAGYPQGSGRLALGAEIFALAQRFGTIMGSRKVKIRLEVITTDACRKFHADYVAARLITTLSGPGTQWIEADEPEAINEMKAGEVGLFKGRLLASEPGILHRSVPLSKVGGSRLLLVLDPAQDAKTSA